MSDLLLSLADQARLALEPLHDSLDSAEQWSRLLAQFGWQAPPNTFDIQDVQQLFAVTDDLETVQALLNQLLDGDTIDVALYPTLFSAVQRIITTIQALVDLGAQPQLPFPFNQDSFWSTFPEELINDLLVRYLKQHQGWLFGPLVLWGVIEEVAVDVAGAIGRINYSYWRFTTLGASAVRGLPSNANLVKTLNPAAVFADVYGWGAAEFDDARLLNNLAHFFERLGFRAYLRPLGSALLDSYYSADNPARARVRELVVPIVGSHDEQDQLYELSLAIFPIPPAHDRAAAPVGVALSTSIIGRLPTYDFGALKLTLKGGFEIDHGIFVELRPQNVTVRFANAASAVVDAECGLRFQSDQALLLIGDTATDFVQIGGYSAHIRVAGTINEPQVAIGFSVDQAEAVLDLGAPFANSAALPTALGWRQLSMSFGDTTMLDIDHLRVQSDLVPGLTFEGDLRLPFKNGQLTSDAQLKLYQPEAVKLELESVHLDRTCLTLRWSEDDLNRWLRRLTGSFFSDDPATTMSVTLQIMFGAPIKYIRLDWALTGVEQSFAALGFKLTTPTRGRLSALLSADADNVLRRLALTLTLPKGETLTASSNFAWERDGQREINNDDERDPANPLLTLTLTAQPAADEISLVLLDLTLGKGGLPTFFQHLTQPLPELKIDAPETLHTLIDLTTSAIQAQDWQVKLAFNLEDGPFALPFLKNKKDQTDAAHQLIEISAPQFPPDFVDFSESLIRFFVQLKLHIGSLSFDTRCDFAFSWRTFALQVKHDQGIKLYGTKPEYPDPGQTQEHLGLNWRVTGAPETVNGEVRHHYFTLVTKNYNYQIQQAPGATVAIEFTKASEDPISFSVSDFTLSPKGINLTAHVIDQPVRLNGISTRFRFNNSGFKIVENRITDFTLAGSGPLPPDLVGDAVADIALQFKQVNDSLTLVAGGAQLKGHKLLDCKATRFQFSVDALGLKFVNDGKIHLYFTLSGNAQFVLAPGDDKDNALALLPKIRIDLVECPLAGDVRVLARHIKFLIELPKPKSFSFLGAFEMELRAIGFLPAAAEFDGDAAMQLTGKLKFVQGIGDTPDERVDYHVLLIGLPAPGEFFPRIHFKQLPVNINLGAAFKLNGVVEFIKNHQEQGFSGEGTLEIQGLPTFAAAFAFLRVRRDEQSPWLRAWFIYLEVRKISFRIPVVELYIREVGLGFGYRYTLASIKAADRANDVRKLLKELQALSRTQGELSKRDRWSVDLEEPGQDPRWTVALRALISQTSASVSPLSYDQTKEAELPCVFLFDAVIAFRSDFTFLMAVRMWLNTNYNDYMTNRNSVRDSALLTGFVLLSARQKRLLANVSSNPNGKLGDHPPLPDFVKQAIQSAQFTMTLLIEPGLIHYELGWPNMLRWKAKLGSALEAEFQGGFIFRVSKRELVTGTSFLARASLSISGEVDLGLVGVRVSAQARVAFGARYIGVISFTKPAEESALYGAIGLEANITFSIAFWIKIPLVFTDITLRFSFSLAIGFTAGLEIGIDGLDPTAIGFRGAGTLSVSAMGHSLEVSVKLAYNETAVNNAFARTSQFLNIGLEATDVEGVPGVSGAGSRELPQPISLLWMRSTRRARGRLIQPAPFSAPDYSVFVVRRTPDAPPAPTWTYFVLLPRAEREVEIIDPEDGTVTGTDVAQETGFLPPPPHDTLVAGLDDRADWADFSLTIPSASAGEQWTIEQFDPHASNGQAVWQPIAASDGPQPTARQWRANWNRIIVRGAQRTVDEATHTVNNDATPVEISLRDYLVHAYITETGAPEADPKLQKMNTVSDPAPLPDRKVVEDERVHNPSDNAFEAAVRGAWEQFRGSPFFKHDPNSEYERALKAAFQDTTTIYTDNGVVPQPGSAKYDDMQRNQQARQLRGMIVHDFIADVRDYAASPADTPPDTGHAIPFQMGLVFRVKGAKLPAWLDGVSTPGRPIASPTIQQRIDQDSPTPNSETRTVRTYNVAQTDFAINAPQFQRVRHFTDANTIALAWDLTWDATQIKGCVGTQADPEQHLMHYVVRRRALSGDEREVVTTVKPTHALHREPEHTPRRPAGRQNQADEDQLRHDVAADPETILKQLRPRFQVVDHFNHETQTDLATLPAEGRSYLYTITPVDFAGHAGRPLTLVATRMPNQPPQVPVNAELIVTYQLQRRNFNPAAASSPQLIRPQRVHVEWSQPATSGAAPYIAVEKYVLIFRREPTLPIGSYGLDSSTQRPRYKALPTSNARPLPTDIRIEIPSGTLKIVRRPDTDQPFQIADLLNEPVAVDLLRSSGVLSSDNTWRPEAWRMFVQAIAKNGVPSALAPVQLLLRIEPGPDIASADPDAPKPKPEERRPAELEWLPRPEILPLLGPEDQRAVTGLVCVPMPHVDAAQQAPRFEGHLEKVSFQEHPAAIRMIRFRWNQAPSERPDYPLTLNAGFHLLQLDIDAHTDATLADAAKLAPALRHIQELQMLPADDLPLAPSDTLSANQWEAWYPSAVVRLRQRQSQTQPASSQSTQTPWFSWRESYLEWPAWPDLTDGNRPSTPLHPLLQALVDRLDTAYIVDLQTRTPHIPGTLASFQQATAAKNDPYGWSVLQRLGLSVTCALRKDPLADGQDAQQADQAGQLITGVDLLAALNTAIAETLDSDVAQLKPHLHVEILVQPGKSARLPEEQGAISPTDLLGLVQISLRPVVRQYLQYARLEITGPANTTFDLVWTLHKANQCSLINQTDLVVGQIELAPQPDGADQQTFRRSVTLPLNGATAILVRTLDLSKLQVQPMPAEGQPGLPAALNVAALAPFGATDEHSIYFTAPAPEALAPIFADKDRKLGPRELQPGAQWLRLKRYLESLNSADKTEPQIEVPLSEEVIAAVLPATLAWLQRFFDASGGMALDQDDVATPAEGPWLATAYPRAGSPAYVSPDPSGRLQYDQLLEDKWAHTYRYYIRPYGRYEQLWRSLRTSPQLFPNPLTQPAAVPEAAPDPAAGGLDVVLDRLQPVERPLILSSRRLDPPSVPGAPLPPGTTWEVIIAQHPEQQLIERNQTLARQLAFRHVSFTLLRRFAYGESIALIKHASIVYNDGKPEQPHITIRPIADRVSAIPGVYPERPDHIEALLANADDTTSALGAAPLDDATARTLDLPERLGAFHQGALVLQWDALPFFYEHRLLAVAHTASTVSSINEVTQRDFEYRSPEPQASITGAFRLDDGQPTEERTRSVRIPLRRLWDALPPAAQAEWRAEAPDPLDSAERSRVPASLPDLDVVYQIVEVWGGNIEVQAEFYFDRDQQQQCYRLRQLGRRLIASEPIVLGPPADQPQLDWVLTTDLDVAAGVPVTAGAAEEPITRVPAKDIVDQIVTNPAVTIRAADACALVWDGPITADERTALLALGGDEAFSSAIRRLIKAAGSGITREFAPPGPDQAPTDLADRVRFEADVAAKRYTRLIWNGSLSDADEQALRRWAAFPTFTAAVEALIRRIRESVIMRLAAPRPLQHELPEALVQQLQIGAQTLSWSAPGLTEEQRTALAALPGDEAFRAAVTELLTALANAPEASAPLPEIAQRPRQADLPPILQQRLIIAPTQLIWSSGFATDEERTALETLRNSGDEPFQTALSALLDQLGGPETKVTCAIPLRPQPEDVPPALQKKLLIGRALLSFAGLMTIEEGRALQQHVDLEIDMQAIQRLYSATLSSGMQGRMLLVRARRGSANVSQAHELELLTLDHAGEAS